MSIAPSNQALMDFAWTPQPEASRLVGEVVQSFIARCVPAEELRVRMLEETGTRLADWVDTIILPDTPELRRRLAEVGFVHEKNEPGRVFAHHGGIFPRFALSDSPVTKLLVKVESAVDFAAVWGLPSALIQGGPLSLLRRLKVGEGEQTELWVIERHGLRGLAAQAIDAQLAMQILQHTEAFQTRARLFDNEADGFSHLHQLLDAAIADLGVDLTCDLYFTAERAYWQRRNRAAQVQKARQDRLGLGWANHDHHTYRSSRQWFSKLIGVFEKLGFVCRERFYAGAEAGWGAQILEQATAGIIIFADVDLAPEELSNDFAHEPLAEKKLLGTVGLWCALHGEAILQAGMHHLECQFDFDALKEQLEGGAGVRVMTPFTDFPYLRQAFTEGERWPVAENRLQRALGEGHITPQQADEFRKNGALGSHLENLERNDGFKGFNQKGVSEIIAKTDPRRNMN